MLHLQHAQRHKIELTIKKMNTFKKITRAFAITCIIILAVVGVGITGATPLFSRNREIDPTVKTELVETKKDNLEQEDSTRE